MPVALTTPIMPGEFFIQGITKDGKPFRPSDWAERLCGVMAQFRPAIPGNCPASRFSYSPYVRPIVLQDGIKCVVVNERLGELEPKALAFVLNFAKDNDLHITQACAIDELSK